MMTKIKKLIYNFKRKYTYTTSQLSMTIAVSSEVAQIIKEYSDTTLVYMGHNDVHDNKYYELEEDIEKWIETVTIFGIKCRLAGEYEYTRIEDPYLTGAEHILVIRKEDLD